MHRCGAEQLGLGGGELVVGQRAGLVHLREPAELVDLAARRRRRGCELLRRRGFGLVRRERRRRLPVVLVLFARRSPAW
jgi:hypothetical protein